ncbi:MAG: cobalamin-binding protein [Deltaproteobacteria bacterium]|nr:cobalamin-binding protein [Deltaproteobacteria bacterium]
MRICSLLPSSTEIVFALGLGEDLVAVTHECDYPPDAKTKPVITASIFDPHHHTSAEIDEAIRRGLHEQGTIYRLDAKLLDELRPDLILTQELCDVCAVAYSQVTRAARLLPGNPRVVSLDPNRLGDILDNICLVGELTGREARAREVVAALGQRIREVAETAGRSATRPRVFSLDWVEPPIRSGQWIPEMVRLAGGVEGLGVDGAPATRITWEEIAAYAPEVIVIMPCGFGIDRILRELEAAAFPEAWDRFPATAAGRVYVVDGNAYFNRPGPRMVDSLELLARIIHPELYPGFAPRSVSLRQPNGRTLVVGVAG